MYVYRFSGTRENCVIWNENGVHTLEGRKEEWKKKHIAQFKSSCITKWDKWRPSSCDFDPSVMKIDWQCYRICVWEVEYMKSWKWQKKKYWRGIEKKKTIQNKSETSESCLMNGCHGIALKNSISIRTERRQKRICQKNIFTDLFQMKYDEIS